LIVVYASLSRTGFIMLASALVPVLAVVLIVTAGLWVYHDAKQREQRGVPVTLATDFVTFDTPAGWALGSVVLCIVVLPLYLTARRQP
jgi:hypothetical protein